MKGLISIVRLAGPHLNSFSDVFATLLDFQMAAVAADIAYIVKSKWHHLFQHEPVLMHENHNKMQLRQMNHTYFLLYHSSCFIMTIMYFAVICCDLLWRSRWWPSQEHRKLWPELERRPLHGTGCGWTCLGWMSLNRRYEAIFKRGFCIWGQAFQTSDLAPYFWKVVCVDICRLHSMSLMSTVPPPQLWIDPRDLKHVMFKFHHSRPPQHRCPYAVVEVTSRNGVHFLDTPP